MELDSSEDISYLPATNTTNKALMDDSMVKSVNGTWLEGGLG